MRRVSSTKNSNSPSASQADLKDGSSGSSQFAHQSLSYSSIFAQNDIAVAAGGGQRPGPQRQNPFAYSKEEILEIWKKLKPGNIPLEMGIHELVTTPEHLEPKALTPVTEEESKLLQGPINPDIKWKANDGEGKGYRRNDRVGSFSNGTRPRHNNQKGKNCHKIALELNC